MYFLFTCIFICLILSTEELTELERAIIEIYFLCHIIVLLYPMCSRTQCGLSSRSVREGYSGCTHIQEHFCPGESSQPLQPAKAGLKLQQPQQVYAHPPEIPSFSPDSLKREVSSCRSAEWRMDIVIGCYSCEWCELKKTVTSKAGTRSELCLVCGIMRFFVLIIIFLIIFVFHIISFNFISICK